MTEQKVEQPFALAILAERCLAAGRLAETRELLAEALRRVEATAERWYEAELHRLAGALALAEGDAPGAEAAFERALAIARAQSAGLWMLRAAVALARLRRAAGRRAEARALLAPILAGFAEGHGAGDVKDAAALLAEL
jgi:predicted ATPase